LIFLKKTFLSTYSRLPWMCCIKSWSI